MSFVIRQLFPGNPQYPKVDLTGRTALVTGCNVGLGYETVAHLMGLDISRIVMAVRTVSKGEAAKNSLLQRFPSFKGQLDVWQLDMSSFANVKSFAKRVATELDRLDIAILNAGVIAGTKRLTADGWEETLQVNGISTGLLALLLIPTLNKTPDIPAKPFKRRLEIVASEVHEWTKFLHQDDPNILEGMNNEEKYDANERYQETKLLDVFMVREMAALPSASKIIVTATNPGLCVSELSREMPWIMRKVLRAMSFTTDFGARSFAHAVVADVPTGSYIQLCGVADPSAFVRSEKGAATQKKVWEELKLIWLKTAPEVASIV